MSLLYKIVWKLSGVFILFSGVLGVKASDTLKGNIIPQYNSIIISASTSKIVIKVKFYQLFLRFRLHIW